MLFQKINNLSFRACTCYQSMDTNSLSYFRKEQHVQSSAVLALRSSVVFQRRQLNGIFHFFDWLCVFGGLCVDMWRLVHQWSFVLFWLSFDCFWMFLTIGTLFVQQKWPLVYQSSHVYQDCTNSVPTVYQSSKTVKRQSKQQKWPLVYQSSQVYQDCINSVPIVENSQKTVKKAKMTIGVPIVTGLLRLYQQCTNSVPIVKNSQKQSNSKNDHWCTNRHMSTQSPLNTQSPSSSSIILKTPSR